jgi:tetratricopeptide (TPR) repeat protein
MKPSTVAFENLIREAVAICKSEKKKVLPPQPDISASLHNMADDYMKQGRIDHAEELHEQALEIRLHAKGDFHPDVAESLIRLADVYSSLHRHIEAEPLYRRALVIRQKMLGPWDPQVADCLERMVPLYRISNRERTADYLAERAAAIRAGKPEAEAPQAQELAIA